MSDLITPADQQESRDLAAFTFECAKFFLFFSAVASVVFIPYRHALRSAGEELSAQEIKTICVQPKAIRFDQILKSKIRKNNCSIDAKFI